MTEALFLEAAECEEQLKEQGKRRLNVSGVLKILGVSRSGYLNWKKRLPSQRELRKRAIKKRILEIKAFHALIKREWLNRFKIFNYDHAYRLVFQYIETFYNTVRIHSHCGYLSPNEYEDRYWKELKNLELIVG